MFGFDVFAEIMVVGGLLLLGLTPIFVRLSPPPKGDKGFVPAVDYLKEGTGRFAIALLIAYALGVAGNRLIDDALDAAGIDPGSSAKEDYRKAVAQRPGLPGDLKLAEFSLRERGEATASWLDRHKSYIRILRGSAAAAALLLLSMFLYQRSRPPAPRYRSVHFISAAIFFGLFSLAYYLEAASYKQRVYDLATGLAPPAAK